MNNVFGQYALGGRLGDSIRERQGMAYYVSSALDANVGAGPAGDPRGRQPGERRSRDRVDRRGGARGWCATALTPKELDESRRYLIGSMPRALETNAGIATFLQTAEFFGLGLDYDVRLPDLLGAVTLDEVNAAARRVARSRSRDGRHRRALRGPDDR